MLCGCSLQTALDEKQQQLDDVRKQLLAVEATVGTLQSELDGAKTEREMAVSGSASTINQVEALLETQHGLKAEIEVT